MIAHILLVTSIVSMISGSQIHFATLPKSISTCHHVQAFLSTPTPKQFVDTGQSPSRTRSHTNMQDRTVPTDDWCFFSTHHRLNKQLIQAGCAFSNAHEGSHQFLQARNT